MNVKQWIEHFTRNRNAFSEPDWWQLGQDGGSLQDDPRRKLLVRSLATFQLGESGGGSRLLRFVRRETGEGSEYDSAMRLFIAEEQYHAELLAHLVRYLGGELLEKHWMNAVFRSARNLFHLDFNVQVLLTAELIAEAYYGFLHRHVNDDPIRKVCGKILADEVRHIAFHSEFFRQRNRNKLPASAALWSIQFQAIFIATERAVWIDHGRCLLSFGVSRQKFSETARNCCRRFLESVLLPPSRHTSPFADLPPTTEQV